MANLSYLQDEFFIEQERLARTVEFIRREIHRFEERLTHVPDDWNEVVFAKRDSKRKTRLESVIKQPYFGRLDFREDGNVDIEEHYIGKESIEGGTFSVVGWRTDFAQLWYAHIAGRVVYESPDGKVYGNIYLKRHIQIEKCELRDIRDEINRYLVQDIEISSSNLETLLDPDEYLREILEGKRGTELQEIVSTIRFHQNTIIRTPLDKILIVQGSAGSGKTTVALHRVAYLLRPEGFPNKRYQPQRILIIGPNTMFLEFISNILPSLDMELKDQVPQKTFVEWILEITDLKDDLDADVLQDKTILDILDGKKPRNERVSLYRRSQLKGSLQVRALLDRLIEFHRNKIFPQVDVKCKPTGRGSLGLEYFVSRERVAQILKQTSHLPLNRQRETIIERITQDMFEQHEKLYPSRVDKLKSWIAYPPRNVPEETVKQWNEWVTPYKISQLETTRRNAVLSGLKSHIRKEVEKRFIRFSPVNAYKELLTNGRLLRDLSLGIIKWDIIQNLLFKGELESFQILLEDIVPLAYLYLAAEGNINAKINYDHIVVDEAQDLSPLEMWILRQFVTTGSMTILGDLAQSIYSYRGINDWEDLNEVFLQDTIDYQIMTATYRTTYEIMSFGNKILESPVFRGKYQQSDPFKRYGEPVKYQQANTIDELVELIENQLGSWEIQYQSIAIICKTLEECAIIKTQLNNSAQLVTDASKYRTGLIIIPCYLTKGLEFQACVIANASQEQYTDSELDGRLLYVAITRAQHELAVFWLDQVSSHLSKAIDSQ
ncbi:MAG: hypothetical protein DPW16_01105 [Chloroflexi bacterium]|nr:hypothetical protein [Chloroflexota bacterium]